MHLSGQKLLSYAGWTWTRRQIARNDVLRFVNRRVFKRLGAYGSRVGRLQIVIGIMAEYVVRVSNRDIAVSVLCDALEEVRNGPEMYAPDKYSQYR